MTDTPTTPSGDAAKQSALDEALEFFDPGSRARECGDGARADAYERARAELADLRWQLKSLRASLGERDNVPVEVWDDAVRVCRDVIGTGVGLATSADGSAARVLEWDYRTRLAENPVKDRGDWLAQVRAERDGLANALEDATRTWTFNDYQHHTHSWHDREDWYERHEVAREARARLEETK